MRKIDFAYAAGVLDADGNIAIVKRQKWSKRHDKYHVQIRLGMCDKEVPEWFKNHFGGSISIRHRHTPKWRDLYTWLISHKSTLKFLKSIEPYLIVKKAQAQLAVEFQLTKVQRNFRLIPKTDEEFAKEEEKYLMMRQLKNGSHKG